MITLLRNTERRYVQCGRHDRWLTFYPGEQPVPPTDDFAPLAAFDEIRIPRGGASVLNPQEDAEIVTYVYRGALLQKDSNGKSSVVRAGEFQHMVVGRGTRCRERAAGTDGAHVFRISLRPAAAGLAFTRHQERYSSANRHNELCVVASPDGREGSMRILHDVVVCSCVLDPGHHQIREIEPERRAWLHVVCGEVALQDQILTLGDGAAVTNEPLVSFTAQERTEVLLIDLGSTSRTSGRGGAPSSPERGK